MRPASIGFFKGLSIVIAGNLQKLIESLPLVTATRHTRLTYTAWRALSKSEM
jgi:hypothetical protein